MLVFPLLAASLVATTSPDNPPAFGSFSAVPLASAIDSNDDASRGAKRGMGVASSKADLLSAKQPSRGRSISTGALKALEGSEMDDESFEPPRRPPGKTPTSARPTWS